MNIYQLRYRELGRYTSSSDIYNILADDLASAFVIGNKEVGKMNPGIQMEPIGAEEIARDVIAAPRAVKKAD